MEAVLHREMKKHHICLVAETDEEDRNEEGKYDLKQKEVNAPSNIGHGYQESDQIQDVE
jgi:hypothetical protein